MLSHNSTLEELSLGDADDILLNDICQGLRHNHDLKILTICYGSWTMQNNGYVCKLLDALQHNTSLIQVKTDIFRGRPSISDERWLDFFQDNYTLEHIDGYSTLEILQPFLARNRIANDRRYTNLRIKASRKFAATHTSWPQELIPTEVNDIILQQKNQL